MLGVRDLCYIIACVVTLFIYIPMELERHKPTIRELFETYLGLYNKLYENDTVYQLRLKAFEDSVRVIENLNTLRRHNHSAHYGWTKYTDWTHEEFLSQKLLQNIYSNRTKRKIDEVISKEKANEIYKNRWKRSALPDKVDWREKKVIGKVINQKNCGACWALSVIANIESMHALKSGKFESLSAQQLVDCSTFNSGCDGGDMCAALEWMLSRNVTVERELDYPFVYKTDTCKTNKTAEGVKIVDYACDDLSDQEDVLLKIIADYGPVSVAINAVLWQHYLGGVIQYHCNSSVLLLNHAVQIVGYDLKAEVPHYIVKNSWGEDFGDKGYLYIAIGSNLCGLSTEVILVEV